MVPSPGTIHTASGAKRSRSAKPCFCANAPKIRRTTSSFAARALAAALRSRAVVDLLLDVTALSGGEVEGLEQPPGLGRIVVRDRSLEMLALRRRLAQLAARPPEKAHRRLVCHRAPTLLVWTRSSRSPVGATSAATGTSPFPRASPRAFSTPAGSTAPRRNHHHR